MNTLDHYAAIIGIDWADPKHDLCLQVAGSDELEYSVLPHQAQVIDDWANGLHQRFPDGSIAICIESRKVPLIHALLKYPFFVLYPVNPQTLARYRRALKPSRAKDDPSDAQLLLDLAKRHPEQFHPWEPERPEVRALASLVEQCRTLVADKVRYTNRLTAALGYLRRRPAHPLCRAAAAFPYPGPVGHGSVPHGLQPPDAGRLRGLRPPDAGPAFLWSRRIRENGARMPMPALA